MFYIGKVTTSPRHLQIYFLPALQPQCPHNHPPRLTPTNVRTIPLTSKFFFYRNHYQSLLLPIIPSQPQPFFGVPTPLSQSRSLSSPSVTIADNPCPYLITTCPELIPRLSRHVIIPAPSLSSAPVPLRPSPALLSHYCTIMLIHHYSTMPSLPLAPPHPSATLLHSTPFHPLPPHPTPFHNRSLYPVPLTACCPLVYILPPLPATPPQPFFGLSLPLHPAPARCVCPG